MRKISAAAKANLILSAIMGAMVAGITALLGSSVWWLWGIVIFFLSMTGLAAVQLSSSLDSERNSNVR